MSIENRVELIELDVNLEHGPGELVFVAVVCNGCGLRIERESVLDLLPYLEGWQLGERYGEEDFCPRCK